MPNIRFLLFRIFVALAGMPVRRAETKETREKIVRFLFQIWRNEDYINENEFPDGRLTDAFDDAAVYFFIESPKEEILAAARVILPNPTGFALFRFFRVRPWRGDPKEIAELGRFAVAESIRGKLRRASASLLYTAWRFSKARGIHFWYAWMPERLAASLRTAGFSVHILEEEALGSREQEARRALSGYFAKREVRPYLFTLP